MNNGFFAKWERNLGARGLSPRDPEIRKNNRCGNYFLNEIEIKSDKKVCVDLGAAQGHFILENHASFDRIYAFEPCYPNFLKLSRNIIESKLEDKVVFFNAACTDNIAIINLEFNPKSSPYGTSILEHQNHPVGNPAATPTHKHSVLSLDLGGVFEMIGEEKINFLKCDIEGAEKMFLYGQDLRNIDIIAVEMHKPLLGPDYRKLRAYIEKCSFAIKGKTGGSNSEHLFFNEAPSCPIVYLPEKKDNK